MAVVTMRPGGSVTVFLNSHLSLRAEPSHRPRAYDRDLRYCEEGQDCDCEGKPLLADIHFVVH